MRLKNNFSENINALFDKDSDEDQLVLCYNIFEKGLHVILNPVFEETNENLEIIALTSEMDYCEDEGAISNLEVGNFEQSSPVADIIDIRFETKQENEIYEEIIYDPFLPLDKNLLNMISKKEDSS